MGLFGKRQPEQEIAAMPIFTEEEAAAILVGAKRSKEQATQPQSVVELYNRGLQYGDKEALDALYAHIKIDLGDDLVISCDCCGSVYVYNIASQQLSLLEGNGCKRT